MTNDGDMKGLPRSVRPGAAANGGRPREMRRLVLVGGVLLVLLSLHALSSLDQPQPPSPTLTPMGQLLDADALGTTTTTVTASDDPLATTAFPYKNDDDHHLASARRGGFRDEKKIVVLLTSDRDGESCARTLLAATNLAFRPLRVHFRVFEERALADDPSCLQVFCELRPQGCRAMLRSRRLRFTQRDITGTRGPSVSRNLVEGMVEKELFRRDFYLSVDANVVFTKHWDLVLLREWYQIGNDRAVLSVAPPAVEMRGFTNDTVVVQCSARIHSVDPDAVVEFNPPEPQSASAARRRLGPVLQAQYSERFHFGRTMALAAVRSDPHLATLVVGPEYMRAMRFWTHGHDFYTPTRDVLYYRYEWPLDPEERGAAADTEALWARRRIRRLLGLTVSSTAGELPQRDLFGPGPHRSLSAWHAFTGIDPAAGFNESTTNQFVTCDVPRQYVHYS